jgi:hypothetical protein
MPIPLKADRQALFHRECRSWSRALAAQALSDPTRGTASQILKRTWNADDRALEIVQRAAVSPTSLTSSGLPLIDRVGEWRSVAPAAAIWQILSHDRAMKLSLDATHLVNIPWSAGVSAQPIFVGEDQPAPSLQASFVKTACGPVKKVLVLSAVSEELQDASPQNAAQIIAALLSNSVSRAIDLVAFDNNPGDTVRPPGLLFNVTPISPAAETDPWQNTQRDMAELVGAIADANIDASDVIFVCHAIRTGRPSIFRKKVAGNLPTPIRRTSSAPEARSRPGR